MQPVHFCTFFISIFVHCVLVILRFCCVQISESSLLHHKINWRDWADAILRSASEDSIRFFVSFQVSSSSFVSGLLVYIAMLHIGRRYELPYLLIFGIIRTKLATFFSVLAVTFTLCDSKDPLLSVLTPRCLTGFNLNPLSVKVIWFLLRLLCNIMTYLY